MAQTSPAIPRDFAGSRAARDLLLAPSMTLRLLSSSLGLVCLVAGCSSASTDSQQRAMDSGTEGGGGSGSSSGAGSGADSGASSGGGSSSSSGASSGGSNDRDAALSDSTAADSGADAGDTGRTTGSDAGACGACGVGSVCVANQTIGGAIEPPDDAGRCPPGRVIVPEAPHACSPAPTFHCATLPSTCTTAPGSLAIATCACDPSICSGGEICTDVTPTQVQCLLLAP